MRQHERPHGHFRDPSSQILIVEDDIVQSRQLERILQDAHINVVAAHSGARALQLLESSQFNLIITDVVMPEMTGYELCRHIKASAQQQHIPVMLLTSLTDPTDILQGLECGADNFITKPYEPDYLLRRVQSFLDSRALRTQGKLKVGIEVIFLGKKLTITSEKEQILDLLISTFEDIIRANQSLRAREAELAEAKDQLHRYALQLEGQVRSTQDKYRRLMECAQDAIVVLDRGGQFQEVNRRAEELFGAAADGIVGTTYTNWVLPEETDWYAAKFQHLLEHGATTVENGRLRRRDGRCVHVDSSASLVDVGGEQLILGIMRDVTERNRMQEDAFRLAAIVEGTEMAFISRDLHGIITSWNRGAQSLYGYSAEEAIGQHISLIVPSDRSAELTATIDRVMHGQRVPFFATVRRRKDGSLVDVEVCSSPVRDRQGRLIGASIIAHDISETKRLEEQYRQAQKMEAVGQLAGGVAHDFNNLLTVISGYASILANFESLDENTRYIVGEIQVAGERAASLTRQLLALSRKQMIELKVLDLNVVVAEIEKMLRRLIGEDINLSVARQPNLPPIKADPGQIEQVIMNLVVNARDAMPLGGRLTIETASVQLDESYSNEHFAVKPGGYVMLAVSDTGSGMDAATKSHIFEPFFTTKAVGKGTGLGLATVYGIIKQAGGHIWVYSEPGQGTSFKLYWPQVHETPVKSDRTGPASAHGGNETILLAEDEDAVRTFTKHALTLAGYRVLAAGNGREAIGISASHEEPIHLLLTDVVMPEMGGRQLAEAIAQRHPIIKVLFLSGYTDDAVVRHGILAGAAAFLQKPYTASVLAAKVRSVLDGQ